MLTRQCLVKQLIWDSLSLTKKGQGHTRGAEIDPELAAPWLEESCERFPWFSGLGCKVLFLYGLTSAELNLSTAVLVNSSTAPAKMWIGSSFRDLVPALFKCFFVASRLVPWYGWGRSS
jgi:hypothetical protein